MTSTARDIRYGRRGGRWADSTSPRPVKARPGMTAAPCRVCGRTYRHDQPDRPESCGQLLCHAAATWTPQEWVLAAHLAHVRQAAGIPANALDHEALDRAGHPTTLDPLTKDL